MLIINGIKNLIVRLFGKDKEANFCCNQSTLSSIKPDMKKRVIISKFTTLRQFFIWELFEEKRILFIPFRMTGFQRVTDEILVQNFSDLVTVLYKRSLNKLGPHGT